MDDQNKNQAPTQDQPPTVDSSNTAQVPPTPAEPKAEEASTVETTGESEESEKPKETKPKEDQAPEVRHPKADTPDSKWYIVHTYSGHENKVAKSLKQRVQSLGFEDR